MQFFCISCCCFGVAICFYSYLLHEYKRHKLRVPKNRFRQPTLLRCSLIPIYILSTSRITTTARGAIHCNPHHPSSLQQVLLICYWPRQDLQAYPICGNSLSLRVRQLAGLNRLYIVWVAVVRCRGVQFADKSHSR